MKTRFLKSLIIPILLILGYLMLVSYPYFFSKINRNDSLGPLSLVEEKNVNIQKTFSPQRRTDQFDNHLLAGEKVSGKFKATGDNFGIFLFRFAKLSAKISDVVTFRIKKEGDDKWYYENNYNASQFQPDQYFTFGFPPFINSKNNTYIFEIESLSGTYKNGIGTSLTEPKVAVAYKYSIRDLKNLNTLSSFTSKKLKYVLENVNFLKDWKLLVVYLLPLILIYYLRKKKITASDIIEILPFLKKNHRKILKVIEKKIVNFSKKATHLLTSTKFYLLLLNTNTKKRIAIGMLIFLLALTYRFSATLVDQLGVSLFYYALGGGGDYDQFIRAGTCVLTNFCSRIIDQNMALQAPILGMSFKMFGFTGGLKAHLYLMMILSSIVATLPYFLLSRKNWITIGGIIGGLYLATSDFLTHMSLNFPPDNISLFTFSMFFVVYLLTINIGTIRWILVFGLMGTIDGFNKALFLINDLAAFALFIPVFFYEKAIAAKGKSGLGRKSGSIFNKKSIKILFLSSLPLLIFLTIYSAWEYFVYIKFSAPYFLRGLLLSGGSSYTTYTSLNDTSLGRNLILTALYLSVQGIVMLKHLIEFADLQTIYLAPIFVGLLSFSFIKAKFPVKKFIITFIFSMFVVMLLTLIKGNYYNINEIFNGHYTYTWTEQIYLNIFLLCEIIILFIVNLKFSALKLSLPIIPYVVMLIIMAKNAPFARLHTHVIVWSIIFLAFLTDFIMMNVGKYSKKIRIFLGLLVLILFIFMYMPPKILTMTMRLNSGIATSRSEIKYLKWVEESLPANAVILAGGKSDLVTIAENIKKPIIYNTMWTSALLIKPNEVPGVKPSNFTLVTELQNKDNFKINKYIVLEDDIYVWRDRVIGVADAVFTSDKKRTTSLHGDDYSIKLYKYNPTLKKGIYELNISDTPVN